jgi:hypothetical protein
MSLFRKLPLALGIAPLLVLLAACAISAESTNDSQSSLSGTLAEAKACAIRDGYAQTPLDGFTSLTHDQLPGALQALVPTHSAAIAKFGVYSVGTVYLVQDFDDSTTFYDASAAVLARRDASGAWSIASGTGLSCDSDKPSVDASPPTREDGGLACGNTDVLEVEPNDTTPQKVKLGDTICGGVRGSDLDSFVFAADNAATWGIGWLTAPDSSRTPGFNVYIDGVQVNASTALAHTDRGTHVVQVSSEMGTPFAYELSLIQGSSN